MPPREATKVFAQLPCAALRPFVRRFLVVEHTGPRADSHLPGTGLVAAFQIRGQCRLGTGEDAPSAAVTGLFDQVRHHAHSRGNTVVLTAFTSTGAAVFLRHSLDELANTTAPLGKFIGDAASLAHLNEQLAEAPNHARRVRRLEDFLLTRIDPARADPLVRAAVAWIERAPPSARIGELVRYIGLSQSALERRFRRIVGATPKRFASLVRLQRIQRLRSAGGSLTTLAHAAGYFDQAHFTHDFRRMTGVAPEAYFAAAG
ncbi:MAG: helix-turn-helix domain-containing protein [Opitutae bacterium]|nr:helix-turn-helix domain-containing protein [Opitutae bacterium]